jgi:leucyl-tRNA synthetase
MAVPAHDERDYAFAVTYGLPIRRVVAPRVEDADEPVDGAFIPHAGGEVLVNSGPYTGMPADDGGKAILQELEARGKGTPSVTYRLHDWLISRQRYWGTPIPVIYCEKDGIVPVPEEELPVRLPDTVDYRGSGENPLARDEAFMNVTCPVCSGPAKRETDTMDTFIDSSWYWYRYLSPERAGASQSSLSGSARQGARRWVSPQVPLGGSPATSSTAARTIPARSMPYSSSARRRCSSAKATRGTRPSQGRRTSG